MFLSSNMSRRKWKHLIFISVLFSIIVFSGVFNHILERDFYTEFSYPYDGDIEMLVEKLKKNVTPDVPPINLYNFNYIKNVREKCIGIQNLRLVYIVKTSPENFDRRIAIRSTWGYEKRFSDVEIRTVFLLGDRNYSPVLQKSINEESRKFSDIIQANFTDSYYNNTYKTMMGMQWSVKYCPNAKFYMFVDDDYYVSTKNVLRFIRYPTNYPKYLKEPMSNINIILKNKKKLMEVLDFELVDDVRLYTGYAFISSPHRHYFSKWFVSLKEYPFHMWPPYVTAGAYILSRTALIDMYYTSFYTQHFRFDDIYVGLLAYKAKIEPYHCEEFHFYKQTYNKFNFEYTIASHGYDDSHELVHIWTEQKALGNA